jgi:hypothetical protein
VGGKCLYWSLVITDNNGTLLHDGNPNRVAKQVDGVSVKLTKELPVSSSSFLILFPYLTAIFSPPKEQLKLSLVISCNTVA